MLWLRAQLSFPNTDFFSGSKEPPLPPHNPGWSFAPDPVFLQWHQVPGG